jgi:hypothetical protein
LLDGQPVELWSGERFVVRMPHCDGNGWLTTGRLANTSGGGFTCDIYWPEVARCPARCDAGVLVLATEICARAKETQHEMELGLHSESPNRDPEHAAAGRS